MVGRALAALWRWLRRPELELRARPYLGPVLERDGRVYEHFGPADFAAAAFEPPWF